MANDKGRPARVFGGGQEFLKTLVDYDMDTGAMTTRAPYRTTKRTDKHGHSLIRLPVAPQNVSRGARETYYHRVDHLVWLYVMGVWPDGYMEHLNGILEDDRVENLVHLDTNGRRWWFGVQPGATIRALLEVEPDPSTNLPAVDVYHEGNGVNLMPRFKSLMGEAVREVAVEPVGEYPKGEFGKDWS